MQDLFVKWAQRLTLRDPKPGNAMTNEVDPLGDSRYWAFISYSHTDKAWGDWLHKALETYSLPKNLQGASAATPKRLFPVFRDREELPTSSNLLANIRQALEQSRSLIVICSPSSAASPWVNEEILQFKRMGRTDRILCLIVDGEPNASDQPERVAEECFPPGLRFALAADGTLSTAREEPIAADARPAGDSRRDALLKVIAGVLGLPFDALRRRDQQRRSRRLALGLAAALLLALGSTALTAYALRQKARAEGAMNTARMAAFEADAQRKRAELSEADAQQKRREADDAGAAAMAAAQAARRERNLAVAQARATAAVWESLQEGIQKAYPQPDLSRLPKDRTLSIPLTLYFRADYTNLSREAQELLSQFAGAWSGTRPPVRVLVEGHVSEITRGGGDAEHPGVTDGLTGRSVDFALPLGNLLAGRVAQYLQDRGIPASMLQSLSHGKERPKYPIALMNNRVEVSIQPEPRPAPPLGREP